MVDVCWHLVNVRDVGWEEVGVLLAEALVELIEDVFGCDVNHAGANGCYEANVGGGAVVDIVVYAVTLSAVEQFGHDLTASALLIADDLQRLAFRRESGFRFWWCQRWGR